MAKPSADTSTVRLAGDRAEVWLQSFSGHECVDEPFDFEAVLRSEGPEPLPFHEVLGQPIHVTLRPDAGPERHFDGIVAELEEVESTTDFTDYVARMVPRFWLKRLTKRRRIFQHLSVPDILQQVLEGVPFASRLTAPYPVYNYRVQYDESNYDFAVRLMQQEGIYFYFTHDEESHTLVLADASPLAPSCPDAATVAFDSSSGGVRLGRRVRSWRKRQSLRATHFRVAEHHFQASGSSLQSQQTLPASLQVGDTEHSLVLPASREAQQVRYRSAGETAWHFDAIDRGGGQGGDFSPVFEEPERYAKLAMQRHSGDAIHIDGSGDEPLLLPGHRFTLTDHGHGDGDYLVVAVQHQLTQSTGRAGPLEGEGYANAFDCIPAAAVRRPCERTAKPVVAGAHTARVVGGDEISTDPYGRVKVLFHWDEAGDRGLDTSCWVRVATLWAGTAWGASFVPRVGQEVVVVFVDGDPDQPLVVGRVTNDVQPPPLGLPGRRNESVIQSRTVGGGPDQHSELRFVDTPGAELLNLHAEKDFALQAENDGTINVGNGCVLSVGFPADAKEDLPGHGPTQANSWIVDVAHDVVERIGHDHRLTVLNDRTISVTGNETQTVDGTRGVTVAGNHTVLSKADLDETIAGSHRRTVEGDESIKVEGGRHAEYENEEAFWHKARTEKCADVKAAFNFTITTEMTVGIKHETLVGGTLETILARRFGLVAGKTTEVRVGKLSEYFTNPKREFHLTGTSLLTCLNSEEEHKGTFEKSSVVASNKKADTKYTLDAGLLISMKVGGSTIEISPDGITIESTGEVRLGSGGNSVTVSSAGITLSAGSVNIEAA